MSAKGKKGRKKRRDVRPPNDASKLPKLSFSRRVDTDQAVYDEFLEKQARHVQSTKRAGGYLPPRTFSPEQRAYAMAARHYDRMNIAEDANVPHLRFTSDDLSYELGYISSTLEEHSTAALNSWLKASARKWLEDAAQAAGREVKPCEAGCGRLTAADAKGRFLCRPDSRLAALDSLASSRARRKPAAEPSEKLLRDSREQPDESGFRGGSSHV